MEKMKNLDIQYSHPSYAFEQELLQEIKLCQLEKAIKTLNKINALERPKLSYDPIRSIKNSLIASCTLFTRAAIESGADYEDAFSLSDISIKHLEYLDKYEDLASFERQMVEDFIDLIEKDRTSDFNYPINKIVKFIYANAGKKLSVSTLAELYSMSPDYLSRQFHHEVGIPLSEFIQRQKLEIAKNFLEFSQMKITEISTLLDYCNPGHFTRVFKKYNHMTPSQYRKIHINR